MNTDNTTRSAAHTEHPSWVVFQGNVYRADHKPAPFTALDGTLHPDYHDGIVAIVYGEEHLPIIAAAPELLEVAIMVKAYFERPGALHGIEDPCWHAARAAIAKATGA